MNNTINQFDAVDIYRVLQPKIAEYTLFSNPHGQWPRYTSGKTSLNEFEWI